MPDATDLTRNYGPSYNFNYAGATASVNVPYSTIQQSANQSVMDQGYNAETTVYSDPNVVKKILDNLSISNEKRRVVPPGYNSCIQYAHRRDFDEYNLRIGDCIFTIPPEFISLKTTQTTDKKVSIRQENTLKKTYGFCSREILVQLVLNGMDDINGHKVSGATGTYYIDGLRPLLAQFKLTPFLPVENEFLNTKCDISTVSLSDINVATVDGFPEMLMVNLVLHEFNAAPYIETDNMYLDSFIDWDLFRYYYQRLLDGSLDKKLKKIDTSTLINDFKIKVIDSDQIGGASEKVKEKDLYDTSYYTDYFKDLYSEITLIGLNFSTSNILPMLQLSNEDTPTMQYLGGNDFVFGFTFETKSEEVVQKFNNLQKEIGQLIKEFKEFAEFGFIRIENELVNLTGTNYLMLESVTVNTVKDFPGTFLISIECVSYDINQKDRESLNGMLPFYGDTKGTKDNAITMDFEGVRNKARQDTIIERKIMYSNVYPDLYLPKLSDVDKAITKIRTFRASNNLPQIEYETYPREKCLYPGFGTDTYDIYADPDFYVFYPMKHSEVDATVFSDLLKFPSSIKANTITAPSTPYGAEDMVMPNVPEGGGNTEVPTKTGIKFVDVLLDQAGSNYVFGSYGEKGPDGKKRFDCSGLVAYGLLACGYVEGEPGTKRLGSDLTIYNTYCTSITKDELRPGDILDNPGVHIGVYVGDGKTIEAMNESAGVCVGNLRSEFTSYGRLKFDLNLSEDKKTDQVKLGAYDESTEKNFVKWNDWIIKYSALNKLDPNFIKAIMRAESNGDPKAGSGAGAVGLMQIVPQYHNITVEQGYDPETSIRVGCEIIADYLKGNTAVGCLISYNAGPSAYAQYGMKILDMYTETHNYVEKISKFYKELTGVDLATVSGASSGTAYYGGNYKSKYAGKKYGGKLTNISEKDFGKPIYAVSPIDSKDNFDSNMKNFDYNSDNSLSLMNVDTVTFNKRGRLVRAFPTYLLLIADDSGEWLDSQKLWSNYYMYKSVVDMVIHQAGDNPVHTAKITVSNTYQNLSKAPKTMSVKDQILNDPEQNGLFGFKKWYYKHTGSLLGGAKLTQSMVDQKNRIFDTISVQTGARIHIRMGYGSNVAQLPVVFNGLITEMDTGDYITMVAQSDGLELVNRKVNENDEDLKAENGITKLQSEGSDIVASLLVDRSSNFINTLFPGWYEASAYGIENFGTYMSKRFMTREWNWDLCKNIYLAKYESTRWCGSRGILTVLDSEKNINFFTYNKTPWDVMKLCEQYVPEFVCQPIYHQFESRVFYGLRTWNCNYRTEFNENDKKFYEYSKSFSQLHVLNNFDIVDNQIKASSKNLYQNCVAMYSLGGDLTSSPVIHSDSTISWDKQKTKVIDTTISQDYSTPLIDLVWDWGLEKLGLDVGKQAAINVAISNLIESWKEMYQGEIITIGNPCIKPYDYLYINDPYSKIEGPADVKENTLQFGVETGFINIISPGAIATSNMQNSGSVNTIKNITCFGLATAACFSVRRMGISLLKKMGTSKHVLKLLTSTTGTYNFIKDSKAGFSLFKGVETGKTFKDIGGAMKEVKAGYDAIKAANKIKNVKTAVNLIKGAETAFVTFTQAGSTFFLPVIGNIISALVTTIIFNGILSWVFDKWAYENCISLHPLTYKGIPFTSGTKGSESLMPGYTSSSDINDQEG